MSKRGKTYVANKNTIEDKNYNSQEAIEKLKELKSKKFDESVDLSVRLGVDPKYPEQMVRGTIVLPHGTGKTKTVLVIASGEKQKEAEEAGADFYGGEEMAEKIQKENWSDFDVLVSTPDMMKNIGKLGKVLGPKGLMPSPKAGTVTFNIKETVSEIKKGRIEFKVDKSGIINTSMGKLSFEKSQLVENVNSLVEAILKAKPVSLKGKYVHSISISSTMSPSIKLDIQEFEKG
ncbi:MAG: 50S ribosomal protein L1 [Acidobacteriota bacterium]